MKRRSVTDCPTSYTETRRVGEAAFCYPQLVEDASALSDTDVVRIEKIALNAVEIAGRQTMVLRNKHGQESRRQLRVKVLEVSDDGDKSLFVFDEPCDVQGMALLIHAHRESADDQWLYLPALKRVTRISSSNRSGSFMGSEFAYEDLTAEAVEKFTYRYLRDEPCGDLTCTVSERIPVDKKSGYRRQVVWRDKDELRVQYLERYWRAGEMTMENHLTGKSTVLTWTDFQFQTDLDERDFTRTGLKRAR